LELGRRHSEVGRALVEETREDALQDRRTIAIAARVLERAEDRVFLLLRDDALGYEPVEHVLELVALRRLGHGRARKRRDERERVERRGRERGEGSASQHAQSEHRGDRDDRGPAPDAIHIWSPPWMELLPHPWYPPM